LIGNFAQHRAGSFRQKTAARPRPAGWGEEIACLDVMYDDGESNEDDSGDKNNGRAG